MSVSDPLSWFSWNGTCGTGPASCCGPRTVSYHRGAEWYDPHPSPEHTGLPSCTPHIADVPAGRLFLISARGLHSLCWQRTVPLPCASSDASHNTCSRRARAPGSLDACKAPWVLYGEPHEKWTAVYLYVDTRRMEAGQKKASSILGGLQPPNPWIPCVLGSR